jgi:hypothetical protein
MAKCCGETHNTPYCPSCGGRIIRETVDELITFIQSRLNRATSDHKDSLSQLTHTRKKHFQDRELTARVARQNREIAKYTRWVKYLQKCKTHKQD